ncbi:unnamed protein product [Rotaria socialis]|uniref:Uncharacterized protein n=1 Tax=Rotaria socialis TaxID=392032 RepID=A0A818MH05_9BILA|nr:unnamed protein product [Rotaria socialis]CAF3588825.1 unnamed protein product [Rotaria socialis]
MSKQTSTQNFTVVVLLLLLLCSNVNGGPLAYIACVSVCSSGCSAGTALTGTPLCLAAWQTMCAPFLVAPSP